MKLFSFCFVVLLYETADCLKMTSFFSDFFQFKNVKSVWAVPCTSEHKQMMADWRKDAATVISLQMNLDSNAVGYSSTERIGLLIDVTCEPTDNVQKFLADEGHRREVVVLLWTDNSIEGWRGILSPMFSNGFITSFLAVAQNSTDQILLYDGKLNLVMSWTYESRLLALRSSERSSLSGETIRGMITLKKVGRPESEFGDALKEKSVRTVTDNLMKFSFSLHRLLEKMYDFRWQLTLAEASVADEIYASVNGSTTYSTEGTQFGALRDGQVDVGLLPAEYLPNGLDIVDFLPPLTTFRQYFVFSYPVTALEPHVVYSQFSGSVWGVAAAFAILTTLISELSTKLTTHNQEETIEFDLKTKVLTAIGAFAQQGLERTSEKLSIRIAHFFLLLLTSMLFMFYNTGLLIYTLNPTQKSIDSIEMLLQKGFLLTAENTTYNKYQLEGKYSQPSERFYQNCQSGWRNCRTNVEFLNLSAGADRVKYEKTALFGYSSNIYGHLANVTSDREQHDLLEVAVHKPFLVGTFVRKQFQHKELLTRGLLLLREAGIVYHEDREWIFRKPDPLIDSYFVIASLYSTSVAFILLFAGVGLSLLLLLVEMLAKNENFTGEIRSSLKRIGSRLGHSVTNQPIIGD